METARIVSSPEFLRFPGTGDCGRLLRRQGNSRVGFATHNSQIMRNEFSNSEHTLYYQAPVMGLGKKQGEKMKETKTEKKKMKLFKRLTKDLDLFSQSAQGSRLMISEATEVLLAELENLKTEEKEQRRKRKEEKAKLMKSKAMIESDTSSSSSSESSDCDGGKVVNLRSLRIKSQPQFTEHVRPVETGSEANYEPESSLVLQNQGCIGNENSSIDVSNTKIEVCMGGKCKKLGAAMLMEEFERKIGTEGSVVGCKCMGKCRSGPNVRVSTSVTGFREETIKCSVQTPTNPLYIGVGFEDVGAIVANLFSKSRIDECLLSAS